MRLNHVALTVGDREASAAFYGRFFGFTDRVHDDDHLLILTGSDGGLLAFTAGEVPPVPPRSTHFGFEAGSAAEVRDARERFREAGVEEVEWQDERPTRVQVLDPDGYRVDLYGW